MRFSIIVAVYNRLQEVRELLSTAERLIFDRNEFEFIFSDDGSTDGFSDFIKAYKSKSNLNIRYITQTNKGPGAARNHAMMNASGDYFIFLDSDCLLTHDWLSKIDSSLTHSKTDAFGGPDTDHPSFSPLLKAINYSMTSFIGTAGTRGSKKSLGKFYPRSFNMGISRKVYDKIGGMSNIRHGQDMEYSGRIYRSGFRVELFEDAFVYHKRRTNLKRFFKQIFNWAIARIVLSKNDPSLLKPIHFLPSLAVVFFLLSLSVYPCGGICTFPLQLSAAMVITAAFIAFSESFKKYKNLKISFLSIVTLFTQVTAYATGLIWGILTNLIKGEAKGFTKNYYK